MRTVWYLKKKSFCNDIIYMYICIFKHLLYRFRVFVNFNWRANLYESLLYNSNGLFNYILRCEFLLCYTISEYHVIVDHNN